MNSSSLDELARDVGRVESLREVKDLDRAYAQLGQFGRWDDMAALFTIDGVLHWRDEQVQGRAAIAAWLARDAGTRDGATPGSLRTELIDQPLVTLSPDGESARGRWNLLRFLGDGRGEARIEAGVLENEYRLDNGAWRLALLRFYPLYEGDYGDGWVNVGGGALPIVAPHFTPAQAGTPIPPAERPAPPTRQSWASLAARIARLNAEDDVRNLQHAYGYYVDRKMWSDVVELFTADGVLRLDGVAYAGSDSVRRALEAAGPEGLVHAELNDRPIFDLIVDVRSDVDAVSRALELGMLSDPSSRSGGWEFSVLAGAYRKEGGVWRIAELAITRLLRCGYSEGWGAGGDHPTRLRVPPAFVRRGDSTSSFSFGHDVGGQAPALDDLRRRLARSHAVDGAENISAAYGYYLDDFQWPQMSAIFARDGNKQSPFAGYYFGRDRIDGAATAMWGDPLPPDALRTRLASHWRTQHVVLVSHDGRSANVRTRLFQTRTTTTVTPGFTGFSAGMYPNDQVVLEDGAFRLWSLTIDEHHMESGDWTGGWAAVPDRALDAPNPPGTKLLSVYPPDLLLTDLGERMAGFRGGPGRTLVWPEILPMWYSYRNLVTGRVPDRYWPGAVPDVARPESSLTAHGYQAPPTGPAIDGRDLEATRD